MINTENILKVADAIEHESIPGLEFDMHNLMLPTRCGTVACIWGWAYHLMKGATEGLKEDHSLGDEEEISPVAEWLGLTESQASELFGAWEFFGGYNLISPPVAVRCLRMLAATEKVDWDEAYERVNFG